MNEQEAYFEQKLKHEIDSWDLYDTLNKGARIIVIDARSTEAFELEHIPDSMNLPHREMNLDRTSSLSKEALYVTYCDGIGCNASTKGALKMARMGFKVRELIGGLDWWKRDGYETRGIKASDGKQIVCGC